MLSTAPFAYFRILRCINQQQREQNEKQKTKTAMMHARSHTPTTTMTIAHNFRRTKMLEQLTHDDKPKMTFSEKPPLAKSFAELLLHSIVRRPQQKGSMPLHQRQQKKSDNTKNSLRVRTNDKLPTTTTDYCNTTSRIS